MARSACIKWCRIQPVAPRLIRGCRLAFVNVPCSIQPASGSDVFKYAQRQMTVSHSIYFPYVMAITGQMRFVDSVGRTFLLHGWGDAAGHALCFVVDALLTNP